MLGVNKRLQRAEVLRQRSLYCEALTEYEWALNRLEKDTRGRLSCLIAIADTKRMTGDFVGASKTYTEAIDTAKRLALVQSYNDARLGLALARRALGLWREAFLHIRDVKQYYLSVGDNHGYAFTLWAEAGTLRVKGDIKACLETFKESAILFKSQKDRNAEAYCLCGLGGASRVAGNYRQSLDYYKCANAVFSKGGALPHRGEVDRFGLAYSFCGIGNAYRMTAQYESAAQYFKKALYHYNIIGDIVSSAYTLWSYGMLCLLLGKLDAASKYFNDSMAFFLKTNDVRGQAYGFLGLCQLAYLSADTQNSYKLLKKALNITKKHSFLLEKCHAIHLLELLRGSETIPFNIP
ncbi:MAG: tetratricopeptide repeat protein [Candidatus Magnetoovum sp. WYHC-5]|nr:tetratricopeptide repeat protein [Candidatus Magnetoovum sp. WYHC-5]